VLQRSWTVGQGEQDEEAAEEDSVPGAVYVGRASFRMANIAAADFSPDASYAEDLRAGVNSHGIRPAADGAMEAVRTPTERIVLVAGSMRQRRTFEKGGRRRPLSLLFGAAFGVGVMCTLAGQVVLHSREKQRIAGRAVGQGGEVAGGTAASEISVASPAAVARAANLTARPTPGEREGGAIFEGVGMLVAEQSADVRAEDFAATAAVASETSIGMRKFKAHTSRRAAKGSASGVAQNPHASAGSDAEWIDPFSVDGEVASAAKRPETRAQHARANPGNRANQANLGNRDRWVDPFAE
jgi:hypothetical protein